MKISTLRFGGTFLTLGLLSVSFGAPTGSGSRAVTANVLPMEITRRVFDPTNPPPEMPKLTPPENACCAFEFNCESATDCAGRNGLFRSPPAYVTSVKLTARSKVVIWLPVNCSPKVVAHEEAHRNICEHYYRFAPALLRSLGEGALVSPLHASIRDKQAVLSELEALQKKLIARFISEIGDRCNFAQDRFDRITEHGTNAVVEAEAISRSIGDEAIEYANHNVSP